MDKKSYWKGRDVCIDAGGKLATPRSPDSNKAILDTVEEGYSRLTNIFFDDATLVLLQPVWIGVFENGANEIEHPFTATYKNYANGQPNVDGKTGRCVYMATKGETAGQWYDHTCGEEMPFICQIPSKTNYQFRYEKLNRIIPTSPFRV